MKADNAFKWKWNDPEHFEAHREEFSRPLEEILEELRPMVVPLMPEESAGGRSRLHEEWELSSTTGRSGLLEVTPGSDDSFWAYRPGRTIPSHLALGERELTRWICLWGWWEPEAFVIHTIYPGRKAPREIHDPELTLSELPRAIEFWRAHAIIIEPGGYTAEPAV